MALRSRGELPRRTASSWGWFVVWAAAGGAYGAGVVGAASIGIVAFPVAIVVTVLLLGRRTTLVGVPGAGVGAGGVLLYVAFVNRHGPGTVCSEPRSGGPFHCVSELTPWPFLAGGVALVVLAFALYLFLGRRTKRPHLR